MNLRLIYPGSLPSDLDDLLPQYYTMRALNSMIHDMLLGRSVYSDQVPAPAQSPSTGPYIGGFGLGFNDTMQLFMDSGRVYKLGSTLATDCGNVDADSTLTMLQYESSSLTFVSGSPNQGFTGFQAPVNGTAYYLIQVQPYVEDTQPEEMEFYDSDTESAVPATRDALRRYGVNVGLTGWASSANDLPSLGADWIPLYVVAIPAGATAITSQMVTLHANAPFLGGVITLRAWINSVVAMLRGEVTNAIIAALATAQEAAEGYTDGELSAVHITPDKGIYDGYWSCGSIINADESGVVTSATISAAPTAIPGDPAIQQYRRLVLNTVHVNARNQTQNNFSGMTNGATLRVSYQAVGSDTWTVWGSYTFTNLPGKQNVPNMLVPITVPDLMWTGEGSLGNIKVELVQGSQNTPVTMLNWRVYGQQYIVGRT